MSIDPLKKMDNEKPTTKSHLFSRNSRRIFMALLLLYGSYCALSMRSHIGVAMVCMVNATAVQEISTVQNIKRAKLRKNHELVSRCKPIKNVGNESVNKADYHGEFVWSLEKQSIVFSSSFYGNFLVMWFAGYFSDRYGPKIVALIGVLGMSTTILLSPPMAYFNFYAFVTLRIIFGLFENLFYPTMSSIASRWFPPNERSTVSAIFTSGNQLAASLGIVIAAELCTIDILDGWPLIFFLAGVSFILEKIKRQFLLVNADISDRIHGIIWSILWIIWSTDSPTQSEFLSSDEKSYLHDQVGKHVKTWKERKESGQKLPLKEMLTSKAILAILSAQFAFNFSNTLMQTYLPTYFRDVLALNLKKNGLFTALPFIFQLVSKLSLGIFADYLKHKELLSPSAACRLFQAFASFGAAVIFIGIAFYIDCTEHRLALILLSIYGIATGATISGSFTASLCVAPMYTGIVSSFMIITSTIANTLAPALVGALVKQGTKLEWSIVFGLTALINCLGGSIFLVYGTARIQYWAFPQQKAPAIMVTQCSISDLPDKPLDSINHLTVH